MSHVCDIGCQPWTRTRTNRLTADHATFDISWQLKVADGAGTAPAPDRSGPVFETGAASLYLTYHP
jgi:hypothetical protein